MTRNFVPKCCELSRGSIYLMEIVFASVNKAKAP